MQFNFPCLPTKFLHNFSSDCNIPLGVADGSLPDFRMRASSTSGQVQYGAHRARLTSKHTTSGWCSAVGKIDKEYIEIDLGQDTRLSAFETQGVLVWNNVTKRYLENCVSCLCVHSD